MLATVPSKKRRLLRGGESVAGAYVLLELALDPLQRIVDGFDMPAEHLGDLLVGISVDKEL